MVLDRKAFLLSGRIHCDQRSTNSSSSSDEGTSMCQTCIFKALDPPLFVRFGYSWRRKGDVAIHFFPLGESYEVWLSEARSLPLERKGKRKCNQNGYIK